MNRQHGRIRLLSLILIFVLCMGSTGISTEARTKKRSKKVSRYTVHYDNGTARTYYLYRQYRNYRTGKYDGRGSKINCVLTAVSIAASGFGMYYTPQMIHCANRELPYGEKYALQQLNLRYHPRQVYTLYLANQILNDMGIPSRYVPVYQKDAAELEIKNHLASGMPVIVLTKRKLWHKISLTDWRHAIVLVKLNGDGTVTFANPSNRVNCSSVGIHKKGIHLTVRQLLDHFMFSSTGKYEKAYNPRRCGGYILVGEKKPEEEA